MDSNIFIDCMCFWLCILVLELLVIPLNELGFQFIEYLNFNEIYICLTIIWHLVLLSFDQSRSRHYWVQIYACMHMAYIHEYMHSGICICINMYVWMYIFGDVYIFKWSKNYLYWCFLWLVFFIGNQLGSTLMNDLQDQEKELKQFMLQLENVEAARDSLLSQLKDALLEQVQMFL